MTTYRFKNETMRWLAHTLVLALAYLFLCRLTEFSAIPPFKVSLLWLPAGLGVFAALQMGTRAIPGIWLGAALNQWVLLSEQPFVTAVTSFGPAVQAVVIALLAGRWAMVGCYADGETDRDPLALTLRFAASCILGAMVAPTIGALTLCATGLNSWNEFDILWRGWWTGDLIGIFLLAPALWHASQKKQHKHGLRSWLLPLALALIAMGPLSYLLHDAAESGLVLSRSQTEVSGSHWLWQNIQSRISETLFCVFIALGFLLVILARQEWRRTLESSRRHEEDLQKEQVLNHVLRSTGAVFYSREAHGDFAATYVSENIETMTGHSSEQYLQTPTFWLEHLHPEDAPVILARMPRLFEQGKHTHEYRFRTKKGAYLWIRDELTLQKDPQGKAIEITGLMLDITQHKMAEAQMRESQRLEAIGQLTGGLAHDFNNLLGIVVGNLDLIAERLPDDAQLQRQHQTALEAALRGAEVTRSLLAVARRQPMTLAQYDLNALLSEMLPLVKSSSGAAITLCTDLAPGELTAELDAGGLSNVVLNLVINARDAMQGSGRPGILTLRTRCQRFDSPNPANIPPGWYALLEVNDNGCGMPEAVRNQAFEPFFTTKDRDRGTGLGLAMVHGYAEQLGGTARIESTEGAGTTVSIYLPLENKAATKHEASLLAAAPDLARQAATKARRGPGGGPFARNGGAG